MRFKPIPRLPWDAHWMLEAHLAATRSTCNRGPKMFFNSSRHGVGAVIVRDKRRIAAGYNGSPPGAPHCDIVGHMMRDGHCVRTLHAERNAIDQCALDGVSPEGATLYVTAWPCWDCAKDIIRVKIARVYCGEFYDSRYGLSKDVEELLCSAGITLSMLDVNTHLDDQKYDAED
jgi:dCMP deaminase